MQVSNMYNEVAKIQASHDQYGKLNQQARVKEKVDDTSNKKIRIISK